MLPHTLTIAKKTSETQRFWRAVHSVLLGFTLFLDVHNSPLDLMFLGDVNARFPNPFYPTYDEILESCES